VRPDRVVRPSDHVGCTASRQWSLPTIVRRPRRARGRRRPPPRPRAARP
jgi:hypothetical protein